jgi:hypothetical protein
MLFYISIIVGLLAAGSASAAGTDGLPPTLSTSVVVPSLLTLAPSVHDYTRFADGGPDANWYVGFNNAWIVKLPAAPTGEFQHAFIGAKIGRAKTRPNPDKPWIREIIPGKVYMGLSQTPAWTSEQSFFLAETADIPADADPQARVDGVGAAEWFWAEVPLSMVSFTAPNYLIVWSPSNYFTRASSAPILAAAEPDDNTPHETRAWNNRSILGVPPRNAANSLETPINNIYPALAIKLVPPGPDEPAVSVNDLSVAHAGKRVIVRFSGAGEDVVDAWVEASRDRLDWERVSKLQRRPPYVFSLPAERSPAGLFVRGVARDVSGAVGYSDPYMIPYAPR